MPAERKVVTVLFADIVGSTALSERLDPERLRSILDEYFAVMAGVIEDCGGTVEKFIGDAIMAVFGVPLVREDDADRALHAGLMMLDRLGSLNQELEARHRVTLSIRVGINTGEVLAPIGESGHRLISGDAVNVAARLESAAEPGTVLAGERTYFASRAAFRFDEPQGLSLKGKQDFVAARRLLGAKPEAERAVAELDAPMVGRDSDLAALLGLLDEVAASGRPRLITVLGPAGVGKSRLTREFLRAATARCPEVAVLRGRCLPAHRGITYWALSEILRAACSISLDDPADRAHVKLRSALTPLFAAIGQSKATIDTTLAALAATAGIPFPDHSLERLEPQAAGQELTRAWPRFTTAWAHGRVGIVVVEDVHWADYGLLTMLENVIGRSEGALMVVATARPDLLEAHPDFGGGSENFARVSLRPLTSAASEELLRELVRGSELPPRLTAALLDGAEGNPFFLEEMVRRLIDEGALVRTDAGWRASEGAGHVKLPESIYSLLAARIDALPAGEKRVLQEAAVVGRIFWEQPVSRALPGEPVPDHLNALEHKAFIRARSTSSLQEQREYSFRHALLRDVAYGSLPKARRAVAHAEIAVWIEELAGRRIAEFAELVADHYVLAAGGDDADLAWPEQEERDRIRRRAYHSLLIAGAAARRRFAVDKAVQLHEQAVQLAASERERLPALEEVGDDQSSAYHGDDALRAYMQALAIARSALVLSEDRGRLCAKLAQIMAINPGAFRDSPDPEMVDELVTEGLASTDDDKTRANLMIASGACARLWKGSEPFGRGSGLDPIPIEDRIRQVEQALALAESSDLLIEQRKARNALAILLGIAGHYQPMVALARRQLAALDELDSRLDQADALRYVAVTTMGIEGGYQEGLDLGQRALALSQDANPHQLMHVTSAILEALYNLGRWDEMAAILDEHLRAFAKDPAIECQFVRDGPVLGALVRAHRGSLDEARALASLLPDPLQDEGASAWQARLAVAMGQPDVARRISHERALARQMYGPPHALALVEALVALADWESLSRFLPGARSQVDGLTLLGPWCDLGDGALALNAGDIDSARSDFGRAVERFDQLKVPFEAARARLWMAEAAAPPEAGAALASARASFVTLGAIPFLTGSVRRLDST